MSVISPNQLEASHGPEDITADIADIAETSAGSFFVVNLSGQTSDTNLRLTGTDGVEVIADSKTVFNSYDIFRNGGDTVLLASQSLDDQREAFLNVVASQVATGDAQKDAVAVAMSKHVTEGEQLEVTTIRNSGLSNGAREDCSFTGTGAAPRALAA